MPNPVVWFGLDPTAADCKEEVEDTEGEIPEPSGSESAVCEKKSTGESAGDLNDNTTAGISDARFCIRCGAEYRYTFRTYAHLGGFYCPACGYARRRPGTAVTCAGGDSGKPDSAMTSADSRPGSNKGLYEEKASEHVPAPVQMRFPDQGSKSDAAPVRIAAQEVWKDDCQQHAQCLLFQRL